MGLNDSILTNTSSLYDKLLSGDLLKEEEPDTASYAHLKVVDGDTIQDTSTGVSYRLGGYDSPETTHNGEYTDKSYELQSKSGVSVAEQNDRGQRSATVLQSMVDKGMVTTESLISNTVGTDAYGRTISEDTFITDSMVAEGNSVPWDKYDTKNQKQYRLNQKKSFESTGSIDALAEDMRNDAISYQDTGVGDYVGNLGNKIGASVQGAGAGIIDWLLDSTVGQVKGHGAEAINNVFGTNLNTSTDTNIFGVGDAAKSEYQDKNWGVSRRAEQFDREEIMLDWETGSKATAVLKSMVEAPDVLSDSSGDIAATFVPFLGIASKADKAQKINKVMNGLKRSAGTLVQSGSVANQKLEERAKNNDNRETTFTEALLVGMESIASTSLDRLSFTSTLGGGLKSVGRTLGVGGGFTSGAGKALTKDELGSLVAIMPKSSVSVLATKVATNSYSVAKFGTSLGYSMAKEAGQEAVQTIGEQLSKQYGTDKFGTDNVLNRENNIREVTMAMLLGAGAGGAMHSTAATVGSAFKVGVGLHTVHSDIVARNSFYGGLAHLSPNDLSKVKGKVIEDLKTSDSLLSTNTSVMQELNSNTNEDGSIDIVNLQSEEAKTYVYHALKNIAQTEIDNNPSLIKELQVKTAQKYVPMILEVVGKDSYEEQIDTLTEIASTMRQFQSVNEDGTSNNVLIQETVKHLNRLQNGEYKNPSQAIEDFTISLSKIPEDTATLDVAFKPHDMPNTASFHMASDMSTSIKVPTTVKASEVALDLAKNAQTAIVATNKTLNIFNKVLENKEPLPAEMAGMTTPELYRNIISIKDKIDKQGTVDPIDKATLEHMEDTLKFRTELLHKVGVNTFSGKSLGSALPTSLLNPMTDAINVAQGRVDPTKTDNRLIIDNDLIVEGLLSILHGNYILDEANSAVVRSYLDILRDNDNTQVQEASDLVREHLGNTDDSILVDRVKTGDTSTLDEKYSDLEGTFDDVSFDDLTMSIEEAKELVKKLGLSEIIC